MSIMSDYDKEHVEDIMHGQGNWFNAKLLRLMGDADMDNLARLAYGFPVTFVHFALYKWDGIPSRFATLDGVRSHVENMQLNAPSAEQFPHWITNDGKAVSDVRVTSGRDF